MKYTSALFKSYYNLSPGNTPANNPLSEATMTLNDAIFPLYSGNKNIEYKVTVGNLEYLNSNIYGILIENSLASENKFSIGNAMSQKLSVSLKVGNETIPKMANVQIFARYNGDLGLTEWIQYGSYFIDERKKKGNKLTLTCYDSMLKAEKPFIQSEDIDEYPMLQITALNTICDRIGVTLDTTGINTTTYTIDYPNERTMRELLMDIAASNGGNFIIVNGTLKLVKPSNSVGESFKYAGFEEINDTLEFSRITMYYNDEDYITSGDDTKDELIVRNDNATQTMCDAVLSQLSAYVHRPFKLKSAYLNPIYELGDTVQINDVDYQMWSYSLSFTGAGIRYSKVKSPGESAIEHEYPYEGQYSRQIKQRLQEGKAYFGVNISRKNGLHIAKSDGSSETTFNSEKIEFCSKVDDVMTRVFYFDAIEQKFKMTADIEIESVDSLTGTVNTLTSNVNGISATVSDLEGNMSTVIGTVNGLESRVTDAEGNASTAIQTATEVSTAINNTKVAITDTVGLTIYNGGIHVMDEEVEIFGFSDNRLKMAGEIYNGTTTTGVKLADGEAQFYAQNSGYLPSQAGTYCGKIEGHYEEGFGDAMPYIKRLDIIGKNSVKISTEGYNGDIYYTQMAYGSSYHYHKFVGNIEMKGKLFNTVKKLSEITSSDYLLVAS